MWTLTHANRAYIPMAPIRYIYKYSFIIISFPSVDSPNVSTEVCATLFLRYLFFYFTYVPYQSSGLLQVLYKYQLIHRTYQLRVLDYYRLRAPPHAFNTKLYLKQPDPNRNLILKLFETNLTRTETRYSHVTTSKLCFTDGRKV